MTMRTIRLSELDDAGYRSLVQRSAVPDPSTRAAAATIVEGIRVGGDDAVRSANAAYGGGPITGSFRVPSESIGAAFASTRTDVRRALKAAAENIRTVHERQRPIDDYVKVAPGVVIERRWSPVQRVGVYVPGGRAAYPSSLLMGVVPALVAGVRDIAVVSPGNDDGSVHPLVLAASALLGIDEIYATGGAQAIGALAHGTETIGRVDLIVGPGGPWVTAAKLAVYGVCGVDLPAGPSEALIIVDAASDPRIAAADLLCQAEHGPDSPVVLVSDDAGILAAVLEEVEIQLPNLDRAPLIRTSLDEHGLAVITPDLDAALAFADAWAPEHLTIQTAHAARDAERVRSAGSVFVGRWTPESAGDYATGANHVLPTGGLARSYGPLAVEDFGSWRQVQELTRDGLQTIAPTIISLAAAEGLTAHGRCVELRFEESP
jgi:histidinol dehydrogenase